MKTKFAFMLGLMIMSLLLPNSANSQSACSEKKPTCQVVSCSAQSAAPQAASFQSMATQTASTESEIPYMATLASTRIPILNASMAFIVNLLGMVTSKVMNCDPGDCDPSRCMPTNCDPASCNPSACVKKSK